MKTILAYRFSAFGDVAMIVPVVREFLQQNKEVEIVMVTRNIYQDLFAGIPNLKIHPVKVDDYKGFVGMRKLSKELLSLYKPDFVADLHDVIRTKILNTIFSVKGFQVFKIDKGKLEKDHLTDVNNIEKIPLKRTVERYADVFREIGFSLNLSHQLNLANVEKEGIGFAPFAQHSGKMLPLDKSFEVAKILSKNHKIYFFGGGEGEKTTLDQWAQQIPNSENLAGKLSLNEELQVISGLKTMISMDSANMHLASLVGTRCVSVWGSTHPFAGFLGYGQSEEDVVQVKDLTCRPCSVFGDKECYRGDYACLHEIDIQKIIDKI